MKIAVCVKQVPAGSEAEMDPKTGLLIRDKGKNRLNPYDYFAIEAALRAREEAGGEVTAITMGRESAKEALRAAYELGVDSGILVSGKEFAGADVYATAYTLAQTIRSLGGFDLIFTGKQTTDGDTAQTGPALAAQLQIPCLSWVVEICEITQETAVVRQRLTGYDALVSSSLPCVIAVGRECGAARMPTLRAKIQAAKKTETKIGLLDFQDQNTAHYGAEGSPTKVERIFAPTRPLVGKRLLGTEAEILEQVVEQIQDYLPAGE